jgi:hypothetical protein
MVCYQSLLWLWAKRVCNYHRQTLTPLKQQISVRDINLMLRNSTKAKITKNIIFTNLTLANACVEVAKNQFGSVH